MMLRLVLISMFMWFVSSIPVENVQTTVRTRTLMISLDGLRSDIVDKFLQQHKNSYLGRFFVERGVKADYMKPAFPTVTYSNHFTLVTGLHPESHGITNNVLFDPDPGFGRVDLIGDNDANNKDLKWWDGAEPIWLVAKKQGLKTACFYWNGVETFTRHPDIHFRYETSIDNYLARCEEIIRWFTKLDIDFATLYFNQPDNTGHSYGANSTEYMQKIYELDEVIGYLMSMMLRENLLDRINIILVSDHGMTDSTELISAQSLIDIAWVNSSRTVWGIVGSIWPITDDRKEDVYNGLKQSDNIQVYYKEDVPARLNYKNNKRIGPIVTIANEGYTLRTNSLSYKGEHGYDNELVSMRVPFMATGPDFKRNVKIGPVSNVDVYPLLCELIGIRCNPHNGTIMSFANGLNFRPRNIV